MLLYTRLAPPKVPKKRSRAGCSYCKEKKKKCDEIRPQCARCEERGQECIYEPIRPRQRRKRESITGLTFDAHSSSSSGSDQPLPSPGVTNLSEQWNENPETDVPCGAPSLASDILDAVVPKSSMPSPIDNLLGWGSRDLLILSPMNSIDFQFPPPPPPDLDDTVAPDSNEDDVEEIIRQTPMPIVSRSTTRSPSLALIAPVPVPSPIFEFCSPSFSEFSDLTNRRALVDHFCNVLSHLIVFREERGNPFQQLVLPLCNNSQAVMNAMYALASAHLENRGVENDEKSVYFHNKAIQGLAQLIKQGAGASQNEILAAIMLLVYYEVLVQKGRSNIVDGHLKGAMSVMSNRAVCDRTGIFLERAFRFYDVIAALSFGTAPLAANHGTSHLTPFPPPIDSRAEESSFGNVDTLLGMATSLWPIIHRLSNLLALKDQLDSAVTHGEMTKVVVLRNEFEVTASSIEQALKDWSPGLPADSLLTRAPEDLTPEQVSERARLQSILSNALGYRHSAFVYLYRTIYSYPRNHPLVQRHTHVSLTHCVATVNNAGPMGALLWPLFVAACEATTLSDRDLAQTAFVALDRRQGMTNIQRAWCIVQEVWTRADKAELMQQQEEAMMMGVRSGGDLWRRVSADMGVNIVFG
ncbi:fungal-specific transcription factor domain-containing protein [Mariannaea sp. PMI_226]|nr:fungal-specific transcription factor domain-containing protein [Mariannaea sp. PMI_226]